MTMTRGREGVGRESGGSREGVERESRGSREGVEPAAIDLLIVKSTTGISATLLQHYDARWESVHILRGVQFGDMVDHWIWRGLAHG